jgi:Flp pilus assembly secretin CpaC
MHHTQSRPRRPSPAPWGAWTLALLLAGTFLGGPGGPAARAREEKVAGRTILVPVNGTVRLRMTTKKPIRTVSNPEGTALTIRPVLGDPTTVRLLGRKPDTSRVELTDADGNTEVYGVIVRPDVEQLQRALRKESTTAVPVSRKKDAATTSEAQKVQLDVVIVEVRPGLVPAFAFQFLKRSGRVVTGRRGSRRPFAGVLGSPEDAEDFLDLLRALEKEGLARFVAQPNLVTLSGQPASFLSGGEQAIPVPAGLGQVGVQFEEFGTRLNFLPIVEGKGKIHLEAEPEVSNLDPSAGTAINGTIVPGRVTNRLHVQGDLRSGQTLLLGGLITQASTKNRTALLDIRQLPFVGSFFPERKPGGEAVEMVILITPSVVGQEPGTR